MIYRVTLRLFFVKEDEANDFYHDGQVALPKAITINPGQPNAEPSVIVKERCFHDQSPTLPCVITETDHTPY